MVVNDPIADMLTRIRNAQIAKHDVVVLPASNTKKAIAKILLAEGYVKSAVGCIFCLVSFTVECCGSFNGLTPGFTLVL